MKLLTFAFVVILSLTRLDGALPATTVLEVRTTGSDLNGGGWVPGSSGVDYSQQDAPQYSVTDAVTGAGATVTSATANFQPDVVGNLCFMEGGSFPLGKSWWHIVSRQSTTQITLDRNVSAVSTGSTLRIGGALDHPSRAQLINGSLGMDIWVKAGTYLTSSAGAGVYGGRVQTQGSAANTCKWEGYTVTRGDRSTKPIIKAGTQATSPIMESLGRVSFVNLEVDSDNKNLACFAATGATRYILCTARNSLGGGYSLGSADRCLAVSCSIGFASLVSAFGCVSQTCTTGFNLVTVSVRCIDSGSTTGFNQAVEGSQTINCVAYGGSGHGFSLGSTGNQSAYNCIAVNRGGFGFTGTTNSNDWLINCAGYNNTSGNYDIADSVLVVGFQALTANPFVDAAGGNFVLNSTSGGGAGLKAVAVPTALPNGTANVANIGAAETSSSSTGESSFVFAN